LSSPNVCHRCFLHLSSSSTIFFISIFSETTGQIETKFGLNIPWMGLYKFNFLVPFGNPTWQKHEAQCVKRVFLAHLAKGHVSFCHHLASVVVRPFKSPPLKRLNQIKPNLAGMAPGWDPFKFVSDSPALHSRWLLLLKIEISSIVHCCFSTSQNELKF
jgi:hypothetical protein